MRAVGGPDLPQARTGTRHDVGDAELAPDLDQLATGHHDLAALRQRVEHQKHAGGVIVDDERRLRARERLERRLDVRVAFAAATLVEVELYVARIAGGFDQCRDGRVPPFSSPMGAAGPPVRSASPTATAPTSPLSPIGGSWT